MKWQPFQNDDSFGQFFDFKFWLHILDPSML